MPKVFISTAEPSAELHASRLALALRELAPGIGIDAAGGKVLAAAGADIKVDMTGKAVMGILEAIAQLSFFRKAGLEIESRILSGKYDALVVVDAPSFHLPLAKRIHARRPDFPIIYYIAPKLWAWKKWRVKNLRRDFVKTLCIFPFEEKYFGDQGVNAVYAGNPTYDQIRQIDVEAAARRFDLNPETMYSQPTKGLLSVFPGSRGSEIKYLWSPIAKTIGNLQNEFPDLKVAVSLAPGMTLEKFRRHAPLPDNVRFVEGESQVLLAASSAVLTKSGTTTLETALLGKPMLVCHAGHPFNYAVVKLFVKLQYYSLPNILAGREIVRELMQGDASVEMLMAEMRRILTDPAYYAKLRNDFLALRDSLGVEPASLHAAREILATFKS